MNGTPPSGVEIGLADALVMRQTHKGGPGSPDLLVQALAEANKSAPKVLRAAVAVADGTDFQPVTNRIIPCGGAEIEKSRLVSDRPVRKGHPLMLVNPLLVMPACKLDGFENYDVLRHAAFLVAFKRASKQWVFDWCDANRDYQITPSDAESIEISALSLCIDWSASLGGVTFTLDDVLRRLHLFHVLLTLTSTCPCGAAMLLPSSAVLCRDEIRPNAYVLGGGQTAFSFHELDPGRCDRHHEPLVFVAQHIIDPLAIVSVARTTDMFYDADLGEQYKHHPANMYPISTHRLKPGGDTVEVNARGMFLDQKHPAAEKWYVAHRLLWARLLKTEDDPGIALNILKTAFTAYQEGRVARTHFWPVAAPPSAMMAFRVVAVWLRDNPTFDFAMDKAHEHADHARDALGLFNSFYTKMLATAEWPGLILQLALDLSACDDERFNLLRVEAEAVCVRMLGEFPEDIVGRINGYLPKGRKIEYHAIAGFP